MTENAKPSEDKKAMRAAARVGWALLITPTLYVCYFSHLGAIGFVGPDEPRYAWVAREMVESGDWVTPRLYGKPWFEKPVLYYWGAALCFKLFGVSEAAARLPSAVSALLATLALAWLARRLYGAETARWLLLLLPTTVGMIGFSHAAATDMPFTAMLTIAMISAAVVLRLTAPASTDSSFPLPPQPPLVPSPATPWFALVAFGVFLGAAVLAKGPAAIVLCGGAVFFWALFTKRWRNALRLLHPAAIASFCLTALPWYILCSRRNPDFLHIFLIEHNFQRYLTPEFQHIQPFWFYIPIILVGLLPWTPLLPTLLPQHDELRCASGIFFCTWAVFPILFFSISKSKLPGYVLPSVPPLAFVLTGAVASILHNRTKQARWIFIELGFFFLAMGIVWTSVGTRVLSVQDIVPSLLQLEISVWLIVGGALASVLAVFRKSRQAVVVCAVAAFLTASAIGSGLPFLDYVYSSRQAIRDAHIRHSDFSARESAVYLLRRGLHYGLNFYTHQEITEWSRTDKAAKWVFVDGENTAAAERAGLSCFKGHTVVPAIATCTVKASTVPAAPDGRP